MRTKRAKPVSVGFQRTPGTAPAPQIRGEDRCAREAGESPFRVAMAQGAQYATRARLETLKELQATLDRVPERGQV